MTVSREGTRQASLHDVTAVDPEQDRKLASGQEPAYDHDPVARIDIP
jgi:hypothetical protein